MMPLALVLAFLLPAAEPVQADVVIRNAAIHDGSGQPAVTADVAIKGDRIVALGRFRVAGQPRIIDGKGLIAAPGFVDLHTHSDRTILDPKNKENRNYLFQGVTTIVTGNCGAGPTDVAGYFKKLQAQGIGTNVIHLVPHNDVRREAMGNVNREPTPAELTQIEATVERAMKEGAWGISTGLIYNPGTYSKTEELIALSKVVARHGGFYASHMRDERTELLQSIKELLRIGREAGLPVHISHMKAMGSAAWGKSADAIALVEKARSQGQAVTADQYPYTAGQTNLANIVVPNQYTVGTTEQFLARLADPVLGPEIRRAMEHRLDPKAGYYGNGARSLQIAQYDNDPTWNGKTLHMLAEELNKTPVDLVIEVARNGGGRAIVHGMHEEDVRLTMKQPWVATASDGVAMVPDKTMPHPRSYGCFPRKIGHYALCEKIIPLEHAVRSSSGLPADILKLPDRGYLEAGYVADIVLFDPASFTDHATYLKPHQYSTGVRYLFVNGKLAIDKGKPTSVLSGKVLRHESLLGKNR